MDNSGPYLKAIGSKVKTARLKRRMTLQEVSNATGHHITAISFLENGKSNMHILTLKAIADLFSMDVKDFM